MESQVRLTDRMAAKKHICVLTIAGSDSGAGAGVQADARTIHALGGYALTAITAVTAQNGRGISVWKAMAPRLIAAQAAAVLEGFPVKAVKTGLLPNAGTIRVIVKALAGHPSLPLIVDPVIGSTGGTRFLSGAGVRALRRELFPRAMLITPNWPEAEALTGLRVRSAAQAETAALKLLETGCRAALVKGGHGRGKSCRDCVAVAGGKIRWFDGPRIATRNTHGTGCVLSAAIAVELARGEEIGRAVEKARRFLLKSLRKNRSVRWQGSGPAFAG